MTNALPLEQVFRDIVSCARLVIDLHREIEPTLLSALSDCENKHTTTHLKIGVIRTKVWSRYYLHQARPYVVPCVHANLFGLHSVKPIHEHCLTLYLLSIFGIYEIVVVC